MNFSDQYFIDAQKIIMDVLKDAREELLAHYGKVDVEIKSDNTAVTHLDKSLELKIREKLRKFDSAVGFLGEEYGSEGSKKSYWLIDPIDGTEAFTRGIPSCRNLLTFVENDEARYALAYRFVTDDLYTAIRGKGTYKNDQRVHVSKRPLERSWIEFSVNMLEDRGHEIYKKIRPKIEGITIKQDFLRVTDGALDGIIVYNSGGSVWDYAPRALLIEEAGGRVANMGSEKYDINNLNLVATNSVIFDEVMAALS